MDGGDEWRMIRCGGVEQDNPMISRIMLRFRPIAPKPVNGADNSGGAAFDNKNLLLSKGRTKRKYVRVHRKSKNVGYSKNNKRAMAEDQEDNKGFVTLQLLPETSDLKSHSNGVELKELTTEEKSSCLEDCRVQKIPYCMKEGGSDVAEERMTDLTVRVVETWVTVECITDTCMEGQGVYKWAMNLEEDTCPGFVSDGLCRVVGVNRAFKKMVTVRKENDGKLPEMRVGLVIKERWLQYLSSCCGKGFSCHVKLEYTWGKEKYSKILVPCDVWRLMDGDRFAWRLDVEAALTLGRSISN